MLQHLWPDPHEPSHEPTTGQKMKRISLSIDLSALPTMTKTPFFQVGDESYTSYQAERDSILSFFARCAEVVLVYFLFSRAISDFTISQQQKMQH